MYVYGFYLETYKFFVSFTSGGILLTFYGNLSYSFLNNYIIYIPYDRCYFAVIQ